MPKIVMEISDRITLLQIQMILEALRKKYKPHEHISKIYLETKE